jgi:hypothetical protein
VSSSSSTSIQKLPWRVTHFSGIRHISKNVGLQHKIFTHYEQSNVIATRGV